MSDNVILGVIGSIGGIITAVGVILIGYWQYAAKIQTAKTAQIAANAAAIVTKTSEEVSVKAEEVRQTIEQTKATVEDTNKVVAEVRTQTDGHFTAMEKLLQQKTDELAAQAAELRLEYEKVAKLTGALHEARGSLPQRRDGDDPA